MNSDKNMKSANSNSSNDNCKTKERSTQDRLTETSSTDDRLMLNSAATLTPTYNTPVRSPLHSNNRSSERREKPFVIGKDFVECLISRENVYWPSMQKFSLECHSDIKWHHRCILLDWTMEVCQELGLKRQTWWLACNLTDRYLSLHTQIKEKELQLIGVTCLYIASKQEEIYSPRAADQSNTTDGGYTDSQIKTMESSVLASLGFQLQVASPWDYLNLFMKDFDRFSASVAHQEFPEGELYFKHNTEASYTHFFEAVSILDCVNLCTQVWTFSPRVVALAVLQLVWGSKVQQRFKSEKDMNLCFNSQLAEGVDQVLDGLSFRDLLPCLKFVNSQVNLEVARVQPRFQRLWGNDPALFKSDEKMWEEWHSFQVYHKNLSKQAMRLYKNKVLNQ